jgi:hypothetical protein
MILARGPGVAMDIEYRPESDTMLVGFLPQSLKMAIISGVEEQ